MAAYASLGILVALGAFGFGWLARFLRAESARVRVESGTQLAERNDEMMFGKEAAFQSHRLQTRLAAHDEQAGSHRVSRVASYLRRKTNQGKGDEQPKT